jgi:hypothetical protein
MRTAPISSDFAANAKHWDNLDDLRSIAYYHGFTPAQVEHAIDTVGENATSLAKFLHIALMKATVRAMKTQRAA